MRLISGSLLNAACGAVSTLASSNMCLMRRKIAMFERTTTHHRSFICRSWESSARAVHLPNTGLEECYFIWMYIDCDCNVGQSIRTFPRSHGSPVRCLVVSPAGCFRVSVSSLLRPFPLQTMAGSIFAMLRSFCVNGSIVWFFLKWWYFTWFRNIRVIADDHNK